MFFVLGIVEKAWSRGGYSDTEEFRAWMPEISIVVASSLGSAKAGH